MEIEGSQEKAECPIANEQRYQRTEIPCLPYGLEERLSFRAKIAKILHGLHIFVKGKQEKYHCFVVTSAVDVNWRK